MADAEPVPMEAMTETEKEGDEVIPTELMMEEESTTPQPRRKVSFETDQPKSQTPSNDYHEDNIQQAEYTTEHNEHIHVVTESAQPQQYRESNIPIVSYHNEYDNESGDISYPFELVNLSKSDEFIYNSRGEKLHVHSYWPPKPKALIIYLHGYAGHISRPIHDHVANEMNGQGYAYCCLDFHGHGYSEGMRGHIADITLLEDDVLSLLFHLYRKRDNDPKKNDSEVCKLSRRAYGLSFYFMGHSLGGAIALRVGNRLQGSATFSFSVYFKGCVMLSPLILMNVPSPWRRYILDATVVKLYPTREIPPYLRRAPAREHTFASKEYIQYVISDEYPENPDGLTYAGPVTYKTGSCTLNMVLKMPTLLKEVSFPFIVFHDDKEVITLAEGVKNLMRDSKTSPNHKEYKQVNGGRHDVLTNRLNDVLPGILEWLNTEVPAL